MNFNERSPTDGCLQAHARSAVVNDRLVVSEIRFSERVLRVNEIGDRRVVTAEEREDEMNFAPCVSVMPCLAKLAHQTTKKAGGIQVQGSRISTSLLPIDSRIKQHAS